MSRIHRAVEKADREGLLTWTKAGGQGTATPVQEPPPAALPASPRARTPPPLTWNPPASEPSVWDAPVATAVRISPMFVAATAPGSVAAEHYRLLRTRLQGHENGRRTQLLLVTSPRMGDGKTTTSANLALTMAQEFHQRVVLVEADLRRPALTELFGLPPGPGLVDVLLGGVSLESALVQIPGQQLFLLPGGMAAPRSAGLLESTMMRHTLDSLRGRFDRIVMDAPPVTIADTHVLARMADGVVFVVRAGVTPRGAVERALAEMDGDKLLGLVLNDADSGDDAGYGYPDAPRDAVRR
ncbi:MAG: CpsD/CapB family tyrosine-protein kinase [Acidobacteria bacterium]|nr:CpsD/CapB family tyrosine-protein kinase [Acidobacteriota bacterium]